MEILKKRIKLALVVVTLIVVGILGQKTESAVAGSYGLTLAPMNQNVIINPGDSREASFVMANLSSASTDVLYELSIEPFYISDEGDINYEAEGDSGEMRNWIKFNVPTTGSLAPNEKMTVSFTIDVPETASAEGQYVAIIVTTNDGSSGLEENGDNSENVPVVSIKETKRVAHLVYAEITGKTKKGGEILDVSLPSFLFSGNITGSSTIKNTGNVHGTANYTLQVFPLFSDEELFSNMEDPDLKTILPNRSVYRELVWEKTPKIGIFRVIYTVEFENSTAEISKIVVVCPLWLLFLVVFAIVMFIIWLVMKAKSRKKD